MGGTEYNASTFPREREKKRSSSHVECNQSERITRKKSVNKKVTSTAADVTPCKSVASKNRKDEALDEDWEYSSDNGSQPPFNATRTEHERHATEPAVIQHSKDQQDNYVDSLACSKTFHDCIKDKNKELVVQNAHDAPTTSSDLSSLLVKDVSGDKHVATSTIKNVVEDLEVYATNTFGSTEKEIGHDVEDFWKEAGRLKLATQVAVDPDTVKIIETSNRKGTLRG